MTKKLEVIEPFFGLELGDVMNLSDDEKSYVAEYNSAYKDNDDDDDSSVKATYSSKYSISVDYAKELIDEGMLKELIDKSEPFINVFDEIDSLIEKYTYDLNKVDTQDMPECMKVEQRTVMLNLIKVLNYLKGLKK